MNNGNIKNFATPFFIKRLNRKFTDEFKDKSNLSKEKTYQKETFEFF